MKWLNWGILGVILMLSTGCSTMNATGGQIISADQVIIRSETSDLKATITNTPQPTQTITTTPFLPVTPSPSLTPTNTPDPDLVFSDPGLILAPVLMYHHVKPSAGGSEYVVSTDQFRRQVEWLVNEGYETISISDLVEAIQKGNYLPKKPIILTFDDGYLDVYQNAFPVLQEAGFTATIYLIENAINDHGYITDTIIEELSEAGWEFGNHSATHAYLPSSRNLPWSSMGKYS